MRRWEAGDEIPNEYLDPDDEDDEDEDTDEWNDPDSKADREEDEDDCGLELEDRLERAFERADKEKP